MKFTHLLPTALLATTITAHPGVVVLPPSIPNQEDAAIITQNTLQWAAKAAKIANFLDRVNIGSLPRFRTRHPQRTYLRRAKSAHKASTAAKTNKEALDPYFQDNLTWLSADAWLNRDEGIWDVVISLLESMTEGNIRTGTAEVQDLAGQILHGGPTTGDYSLCSDMLPAFDTMFGVAAAFVNVADGPLVGLTAKRPAACFSDGDSEEGGSEEGGSKEGGSGEGGSEEGGSEESGSGEGGSEEGGSDGGDEGGSDLCPMGGQLLCNGDRCRCVKR